MCNQTIIEEEIIEKTLSMFPSASIVLAQQYRNMRFATHLELMALLFLVEKKNKIFL